MAEVQVIPPKAARPDTLRVAAYCRVSSDSADQLHSYAAQIRAYTQAINAHDGWDLVDIYADEGLTGMRMDKREDFNRLMADCRKGNRPSFIAAGAPKTAEALYEYMIAYCKQTVPVVEHGVFGADMQVSLCNDGPFTIVLDSDEIVK